jgi:butyrate kinase
MTGRKGTIGQHGSHLFRQFQQTQRIGDVAAALADHLAQIVLGIAILRNQLLIALCFFKRIEISTLDILDNRDFESAVLSSTSRTMTGISTSPAI